MKDGSAGGFIWITRRRHRGEDGHAQQVRRQEDAHHDDAEEPADRQRRIRSCSNCRPAIRAMPGMGGSVSARAKAWRSGRCAQGRTVEIRWRRYINRLRSRHHEYPESRSDATFLTPALPGATGNVLADCGATSTPDEHAQRLQRRSAVRTRRRQHRRVRRVHRCAGNDLRPQSGRSRGRTSRRHAGVAARRAAEKKGDYAREPSTSTTRADSTPRQIAPSWR